MNFHLNINMKIKKEKIESDTKIFFKPNKILKIILFMKILKFCKKAKKISIIFPALKFFFLLNKFSHLLIILQKFNF